MSFFIHLSNLSNLVFKTFTLYLFAHFIIMIINKNKDQKIVKKKFDI